MENKKGGFQNSPSVHATVGNNVPFDSIPKHQHNTAPQHVRLLQYGLKIPNNHHQRQSTNQNVHPHMHQSPYQLILHRHFSPSSAPYNSGNIYTNPMHQHTNEQYLLQAKPKNQSLHQATAGQPALHPHSSLNQNPNYWQPPQFPVHYHQQMSEPQTPTPSSNPKSARETSERKKNNAALRSPSAKRPIGSPVTLQGWLHKQGSERLMLWKKRWFVLSEYCLFYYKGPEEEKLLGSILLPSYTVSICTPEDKVNKKFAFKCEHTNMRTYILAADSQELMMQWVRLLNLACLLQTNTEGNSILDNTTSSSSFNQSNDSSHLVFSQQGHNDSRNTPTHLHSSSNTIEQNNPSQETSQYNQPLYANAPPKPRRLTDGYSSPSPDAIDKYDEPTYVSLQPAYMQRPTRSPSINVYGMQEYLPIRSEYSQNSLVQNVERRTPDTYGRSKSQTANLRHTSDYEDIYAEQYMYKRPLSPLAHNNIKKVSTTPSFPKTYAPVSMLGPMDIQNVPFTRKSPNTIPRPHSADFLEYEVNHRQNNASVINRQPRPKSSLDINRDAPNDNYFYSEEHYAEKMRKSAQYLSRMRIQRRPENENTFPLIRSNTRPVNLQNLPPDYARKEPPPVRSRSALSEGSLSKEFEDARNSPHDRYAENSRQNQFYWYQDDKYRSEDPFTRSASARLASIEQRLQTDRRASINKEGERKREESMKRLLEWKQRMLQSPLNRKISQNGSSIPSMRQELYYKRQVNGFDPKAGESFAENNASHLFPQYNSYSSDDEENVDRRKESMQAGWTLDISSETAPFTSTPVLVAKTETPVVPEETVPTREADDALTKPLKMFNKEPFSVAHVSSLRSDYSEDQHSTVTDIKSSGALVKSILAEFEKKPGSSTPTKLEESVLSDLRSPKDIEAIIEENYMTMTPKKSVLDATCSMSFEENSYVEMTQGVATSLLDPRNSSNVIEQPYEMVCFSEDYMEPLYMELHNPKTNTTASKPIIPGLPDILILPQSQSIKSVESSDADDEASKDLESIDAPTHPRFSLSDNFRPASYYLGVSQTVPEDSSDSDLVSPPPIPRSPPPIEDLEGDEREQTQYGSSSHKTKYSGAKDEESFISYNVNNDADPIFKRILQNSDSDEDFHPRTRNFEHLMKRRPVSEEFRGEIESMDLSLRKPIDNADVDKYLEELQSDTFKQSSPDKQFKNYENFFITEQKEKSELLDNASSLSTVSIHTHSRDNSRDTAASHVTIQSNSSDHASFVTADFPQRRRPESCTSISAELSKFLEKPRRYVSNTNSPITTDISPAYFTDAQPAPYYYSDLSMNTSNTESGSISTLNNQRGALNGKRDIMHIVNPIRRNSQISNTTYQKIEDRSFKLAAEARSVSVDFLNLADKVGQIDKKNIYESDTLKRMKVMDSATSLQSDPQTRNFYPSNIIGKFKDLESSDLNNSLKGLLENVLNDNEINSLNSPTAEADVENTEGSYLWEEDAVWRERLRSASQRHTKSLDDLDCIGVTTKTPKKSSRAITRGVTYVNDHIYNMPLQDKQQKYSKHSDNSKSECKNKDTSFTIDREKLRQWDLMSSAPSDSQTSLQGVTCSKANTEVDAGDTNRTSDPDSQEPASGSTSLNTRDAYIGLDVNNRTWTPISQTVQSKSSTNLYRSQENELENLSSRQGYYTTHVPSEHTVNADYMRKVNWNEKMNVSAGELLGHTHEELVLLLIQLRRQSTNTCHAIEACYNEIDSIQAQLHLMDAAKRMENLKKLEQIKQHLLQLEKQYEKGKPLVNLVDNMVKLGSLYRCPNDRPNQNVWGRIEFNQQIQEKRMLRDEKRDWDRLNSSHVELQEKVQQLYQLDKVMQDESYTLQGLQQDKEEIERALGGLKHWLNQEFNDPSKIEQARKQQIILENELSRVHLMLAQNSKKLEETVAANARLEQELLVLKQKLQINKQNRSSPQFSNAEDSLPCVVGGSAVLESDLQKVQKKVGDLQRQRHELSMQVRQLTDRSILQQQTKSLPLTNSHSSQALGNKKKVHSQWRETDLDTMSLADNVEQWKAVRDSKQNSDSELYRSLQTSDTMSDDANQSALPQEKQEIKTVRIVKRESERRQRDRERTFVSGKWDPLAEEEDASQNSSLTYNSPVQKAQSTVDIQDLSEDNLNRANSLSSPSLPMDGVDKTPELSPVYKSEAARQIITEISNTEPVKQQFNRRTVPKERRRHYTAPNNNLILKDLPLNDSVIDKVALNSRRARDDLDMERALRQRIDAPDVVRSTLSSKELKYNENTIDNLLGTPNKIDIPERYIPEQLPQLSAEEQEHRLRKVESIKKMLSDTTILSASSANLATDENDEITPSIKNKATTNMLEERKQREHLLQLNQILAKQVMEMSKIVAVKALAKLPLQPQQVNSEEEDLSPVIPLPLYQQRHNFYS